MSITEHFQNIKANGKKAFAILVDPDKVSLEDCPALGIKINQSGIDYIFVGGSLIMNDHIHQLVPALKAVTRVPVVLFPGSLYQITNEADALLFLSLISGRNPEMLIGQHVVAAPILKRSSLEVIPTGYMLIDSGKPTTAHYMSNTTPIPADKPDIAACTALAGEMLGLRLIYLDGGSGAYNPIPTDLISAVAATTHLPLIVGGGIRSKTQAEQALEAGADVIVVGNALENGEGNHLFEEIPELIASFKKHANPERDSNPIR